MVLSSRDLLASLSPEQRKSVKKRIAAARKKNQPKRPRGKRGRSRLELKFEALWLAAKGPALVVEHRFHETRRFRFDFAHVPTKTAIEVEGGIFSGGRHTRGAGYMKDLEKYFLATMDGWRVVRVGGDMIGAAHIAQIIQFIAILSDSCVSSDCDFRVGKC